MDLIKEPAFEIGRRVEIRGLYAWFVVLKPAEESEIALDHFAAELSAVLDRPVRIVKGRASPPQELLTELKRPDDDPVLVSSLDQAGDRQWRALDINRSGLVRPGPVVLWLSSLGLTNLCKEVRSGREIHAKVDPSKFVGAVQALHPNRGLFEKPLALRFLLADVLFLDILGLQTADAIGVVGFVVEHQDILLAADLAA